MPLHKGTSPEVIGENIHEMEAAGYPHDQAVAAALHTAHPHGGKSIKDHADEHHPHAGHDGKQGDHHLRSQHGGG